MSNYDSLALVGASRADEQFMLWRRLMSQCQEAKQKLVTLGQFAERYRVQMKQHLEAGMPASASMTFLGFIGQIEAVTRKQVVEVGRLETACAEQWQHLVDARRDKRMYEILRDRASAAELAADLRRSQAELDELLGRIVKLL
jgi:flagellar export protein FliJ